LAGFKSNLWRYRKAYLSNDGFLYNLSWKGVKRNNQSYNCKNDFRYRNKIKQIGGIEMIMPNKEDKRIVVNKEYILTQKQLKSFLGIEGDIITIGLSEGLSPNDVEKGKSKDTQKFYFNVVETKVIK
jgi:hypothetical protein